LSPLAGAENLEETELAAKDAPSNPVQPIASVAFRRAELESERLRILGVLGVGAIFILVTLIRVFVTRTISATTTPWVWQLALAAGIVLYELWMLSRVNLALTSGRHLLTGFWVLSTILETSIPAFAIAFLASQSIESAYRPLASPSILIFFLFIILFTLRLNPWICLLSGAVASVTYLVAAFHLGWRPPVLGMPAPVTQTSVSLNAVVLLTGGIIAAGVARQIRKHVEAALREAETKRKLEAVEHDLQVARSIQQSLLPKERPQIAGFDIAGWNQPADDTGGDYFDWKTQGDGKLVVSLADVTGHGIGPALVAAICHAYARSSFGMEHGLMEAFEHINKALSSDLQTGRFVTFVAAVCLPDSPDLYLLSAGHGPLFIYSRSNDRFIDVQPQAVPFGILPFFRSDPPAQLRLGSGDLVLLPTDGFFEWENDQGEQFGVERMEKVIRVSRDLAPPEIIAQLYDAVIKFSNGTKQQDDLTAVIIKRL
jgi:serine phosphatase RsbU (regulator of sigma subunit)